MDKGFRAVGELWTGVQVNCGHRIEGIGELWKRGTSKLCTKGAEVQVSCGGGMQVSCA